MEREIKLKENQTLSVVVSYSDVGLLPDTTLRNSRFEAMCAPDFCGAPIEGEHLEASTFELAAGIFRRAAQTAAEPAARLMQEESKLALTASEVICLLVGRLYEEKELPFGYAEVLDFTFECMPKPLADGTLHKCFSSLLSFGFIEAEPSVRITGAGRPKQLYSLTNNGRVALNLAIATAIHLAESRSQAAA